MRRRIAQWTVAVAAILFGMGCATTRASAQHGTAPTESSQAGTEGVTRATLDNGLRVVIVRDALAPVVTTEMNYLAGSNEVPEGFPGTAHAVEHMMFRGSPGLTKDQLAAIAASMGGAFNADTTEGVTQYYFVTPARDLKVALHIASIRMKGVDMSASEWKTERGAIEQEVSRDLSNPNYKFFTQLRAQLFAGSPYAHTGLGTRPSFEKTTAKMLKDFHDTWYAPNNAILVIAGDVDPGQTLADVKALFAGIPRKTLPKRPSFQFQPVKASTLKLPTDSPYGLVFMSYRLPGSRSPDVATARVLSAALGSKRADLYGMGMDGTALFGGFQADLMPQAGFGLAIGVFPRGGNPRPIVARMKEILSKAASEGIDPALVKAAKRKAIAQLAFEKNSVVGLANAWSSALAFDGLSSPEAMKAKIEAVTPEAVNRLAKATFGSSQAITAILTPESSGKPVAHKGFGGAETFSSTPSKPVTLPDWAASALAKLEVPKSTLSPASFTLPNGLRLIVQPETISDTVEVYGEIHTNEDLQAPSHEEGVADVLDDLFRFGTTHMNRIQLQKALDQISARESAGSSFSLQVPSVNFERGMQLLADAELHPALPERAFRIVQMQEAHAIAGILKSPSFLTQMGIAKATLPAGDPALRHATPENIRKLTLDQVKGYMSSAYRPDMTTIVVVGKVTPDFARKVVEDTFGGWKAQGPKPEVDYPKVPLNAASELHVPDSSALQDSVILQEQIDVTRDDPSRFALKLGNLVLGGSLYASRLSNDLRKNGGLVYTVRSSIDLDRNRGDFQVFYGCDPDKVAAARAMVVRDLARMGSAPVSDAELTRAKSIALRRIPLSESSFGSIGNELLRLSIEHKPLNEPTIAGQHYLKLDAAAIQKVFAAHVRPHDFVTAVKGPAPK